MKFYVVGSIQNRLTLTASSINFMMEKDGWYRGKNAIFLLFTFFFLRNQKKKGKLIKAKHIFPLVSKLVKIGFKFHSAV